MLDQCLPCSNKVHLLATQPAFVSNWKAQATADLSRCDSVAQWIRIFWSRSVGENWCCRSFSCAPASFKCFVQLQVSVFYMSLLPFPLNCLKFLAFLIHNWTVGGFALVCGQLSLRKLVESWCTFKRLHFRCSPFDKGITVADIVWMHSTQLET